MPSYRKFVTSSVAFTFAVVAFTGLTFKFFFKTHRLEQIHGWLGVALIGAAVFHIAQNWPSLRGYLQDWRALLLALPVLSVILAFALAPKEEENRGPNPRELVRRLSRGSAANVAGALGTDVNSVLASMKNDGLRVEQPDETIGALAEGNGKSPELILSYFLRKDGR